MRAGKSARTDRSAAAPRATKRTRMSNAAERGTRRSRTADASARSGRKTTLNRLDGHPNARGGTIKSRPTRSTAPGTRPTWRDGGSGAYSPGYYHPDYGYTCYSRYPWWNPYAYSCYYPAYYGGCHSNWFGFCFGFGFGYWSSSWCYPWYGSYWWNYPYYTASLCYPYYRYVYVGSGPVSVDCPSYSYMDYDESLVDSADDAPAAEDAAPERLVSGLEYYLRLGDDAMKRADYVAARDAYRQAVEADPSAASPRFATAEALIAVGDYHRAVFAVREGFERDRAWAEHGHDRKAIYGSDAAREAVDDAVASYALSKPFDPAGAFLLGYTRFFSGDFDGARPALADAIRLSGGDAIATTLLDAIEAAKKPAKAESKA